MMRRPLRWAFGIYLALLITSWLLDGDRSSSLPLDGGWKEIAIEVAGKDGVKQAPLRYRKLVGTDKMLTPVLLIHGSPMASSSFNTLLPELPAGQTYLVPDLPGFGHSKEGFDDYSFDGHAEALKQLLEAEGIKSAHLVAYSQGGGPALKLLSSASERVSSLTLLSSVGVLEHELTGDYFLNQLLYGGQLLFFNLLDWGTPHFGLLDAFLLNPRYAENFYYSDMRPLRSIMRAVEVPVLILHSRSDWLIPKSAALEHFRIVPQSSIRWGKGGHMMPMSQPGWVGNQLADFFTAVENGSAPTRAQADESRLLEAMKDLRSIERAPSITILLITLLALSLGTLVSEDLTCITAGLLAARGLVPLPFAMTACFLGIWIGDMLLYAIGRYGGGKLLSYWPFRNMIASTTIESTRVWLNRRGGLAVLISRFMPGTRLPLYLTAGLVRMNVFKMMSWLAFAGVLWAFPVVALIAYFGQGFSEWLIENSKWMLPGIVLFFLLSFSISRIVAAFITYEGRRKLWANFQRVKRWEFWPTYVFYTPVALVLIVILICRRKPLAFTSCNPGMPYSGLVGESKASILDHLKASDCVPKYLLIAEGSAGKLQRVRDWMNAEALTFPLVIKPDQGERGRDVRILKDEAELE
ncbi:MAG: membrane protein DedA with SNARE-associated domain/pimeloyl-ACP methyl ester carboxylesterase, partial [Zhongshania aliphaticivorans]